MLLANDYMPEYELLRPGLSYNQWLGSVLGAMGVGPEEYAREGFAGYGFDRVDQDSWEPGPPWSSEIVAAASDPLPILVGG